MSNDIPNPTLLFDLENADELEPIPEGSTVAVRGPDGETLAEIDTADSDAFAYFSEDTIVDGAGQSETAIEFYVRDTDR